MTIDPNSQTQRRRKARAAMGSREPQRKKGGGLNSHWCGHIDGKAQPGMPGASKQNGKRL